MNVDDSFMPLSDMAKLTPIADDLSRVREILEAHLPWTPRDFVPGISRAGDRAVHAESLTDPISHDDDLRFLHPSNRHGPVALLARRLPWDSEFFGFGVVRLDGVFPLEPPFARPDADWRRGLEKLLRQAEKRDARYVFATVDPRDLALVRSLGELGFALIETRYYHHGPLVEPELTERFPIRQAGEDDLPSLTRTARESVNPYDRFHADPFLPPDAVGRLMEKWVIESVAGRMADVVLVPDVPEPGAFVTYRYHRQNWDRWRVKLVQGMLSAVSPDFMGWMGKLTPEVNYHLLGLGAQYTFGSTQVTNRAIIHFAQEAGARFGRCEYLLRKVL